MSSETNDRRRHRRKAAITVLKIGLRGAATAAALIAAYYLAPVRAKSHAQELLWLAAAMAAFIAIIALQTRTIMTSRHPRLRAIEAMSVVIPLFLVMFARIYLTVAAVTSHAFSVDLNRTRALYFTITVFSTVGFGDITPQTDFSRLVVAVQMLLDLVVLGAVVRILFGAAERGLANRAAEAAD
jgi:hypothetical protein